MSIFDELRKMGAKAGAPERPEQTRVKGAFFRVFSSYRDVIEKIAQESHRDFTDRFPLYEEFRDAVAECWIKQLEGFHKEMTALGYTDIVPGTKASELNKSALAILTERGSLLFVGPGAFERDGRGAAVAYKKIPLRSANYHIPPDAVQPEGFVFSSTPKVGERVYPDQENGRKAPFHHSSPILRLMAKPEERSNALAALEQAGARAEARFIQAQEEAGLAPVKSKK